MISITTESSATEDEDCRSVPGELESRIVKHLRLKHYAYETEKVYISWYHRYVRFHRMTHPAQMSVPEIEGFLTYLAVELFDLRGERQDLAC